MKAALTLFALSKKLAMKSPPGPAPTDAQENEFVAARPSEAISPNVGPSEDQPIPSW